MGDRHRIDKTTRTQPAHETRKETRKQKPQDTESRTNTTPARSDNYDSKRQTRRNDSPPPPPAVYKDKEGNTFRPAQSKVINQRETEKSIILDHKDGISEIRNKETGKVTYRKSPENLPTNTPPATYTDRSGNTYRPGQSKVVNVRESESGKSVIYDHKDGISEIRNKETGKVTYQHSPEHPPAIRDDRRPAPPAVTPHDDRHRGTGTWTTPAGTVVHRDNDGHITYPNRSKITDIHDSNTGKSWVVEHKDGVREIHNKETGRVTYAKRPVNEPDRRWIAPPSTQRVSYRRNDINITNIHINETNIYLRDANSYYRREPVFYRGYRWEPPLFAPILFTAALTLAALDTVYRPNYPRDSVANMTGASWYAVEFHRAGVYNSYDLVRNGRTPEDRQAMAYQTGIPYSEVRKAVGQADLMRVDGIGPKNSRLLIDAGIDSMQDLARYSWDPESLYEQLKYSSFWDGQQAPTRSDVQSWIAQARSMPLAIYDDGEGSSGSYRPEPPPVNEYRPEPPPVYQEPRDYPRATMADFRQRLADLKDVYQHSPMTSSEFNDRKLELARNSADGLAEDQGVSFDDKIAGLKEIYQATPMDKGEVDQRQLKVARAEAEEILYRDDLRPSDKRDRLRHVYQASPMDNSEYQRYLERVGY